MSFHIRNNPLWSECFQKLFTAWVEKGCAIIKVRYKTACRQVYQENRSGLFPSHWVSFKNIWFHGFKPTHLGFPLCFKIHSFSPCTLLCNCKTDVNNLQWLLVPVLWSLCHQYRARPACTHAPSDPALYCGFSTSQLKHVYLDIPRIGYNGKYEKSILKFSIESVYPFPHTSNLQQTNLKTCQQKYESKIIK